jgi:hypothetical protein
MILLCLAVATTHLVSLCAALTPVNPNMKTFGHSIKAGRLLPSGTEITTFEHSCGSPPCAITQLHCPTAGPAGWELAVIRVYVDGEATPSINVTLLEMANVGRFAPDGQGRSGNPPAEPWGVGLFGHTAQNGGVYSTMRIPFASSVKTTIESGVRNPPDGHGTFWMIVRGIESYPVVLGDLQLPAAARLRLFRFDATTKPKQLVTLASVPKGYAGAVLNVKFDGQGHLKNDGGSRGQPVDETGPTTDRTGSGSGSGSQGGVLDYLEACMRAQFDGSKEVIFLSSGAEDCELRCRVLQRAQPGRGLELTASAAAAPQISCPHGISMKVPTLCPIPYPPPPPPSLSKATTPLIIAPRMHR